MSLGSKRPDGSTGTDSGRRGIGRRRALKYTAGLGIAGLAGCSGGDTDGNGTGNGGGSGNGQTSTTSGGSNIEGQEVHFIFDVASEPMRTLMDEATQAFQEETGAVVNMEYVGFGLGRYERIVQLLQAGNPPEVASSAAGTAISFWNQDLIAPVTDVMDSLIEKYDAPPDSARFVRNGEDYFIPWGVSYSDFWYRQDVVEQAGLSNGFVPDTWDKVTEYAQAVNQNTDVPGMYVAASESEPTMAQVVSFFRSNNGTICEHVDGEFQIAIDQGQNRTRMIETLEFLDEIHDSYSPGGSGADWSTMSHGIAFQQGACQYFPGARPKNHVAHHDRSSSFAADVMPVGHMPENRSTMGRANVGPFVVFKDANTEAGKAWLEFLMGNAEFAARIPWADAPMHNSPAFPGVKESQAFQDLIATLPDSWTQKAIDLHLNEAPQHGIVNPFELEQGNPHMGALLTSMQIPAMASKVLVNDMDPGQAVDQCASELASVLEESKQQ